MEIHAKMDNLERSGIMILWGHVVYSPFTMPYMYVAAFSPAAVHIEMAASALFKMLSLPHDSAMNERP